MVITEKDLRDRLWENHAATVMMIPQTCFKSLFVKKNQTILSNFGIAVHY